MALTGFTDICESFPPFQIKSSRWDESKLKIQRTFLEVFPPDTVLPSVSPPRVILLIFFFFCIFLSCHSVIGTLSTELPKKKQNKHLQFLHQICPKNKKTNQTFTLSARIWTQRCDSDFAQGCKISLESLDGVHVSLTVWPSPTQRPVDALIINCIAKNNPTTRLSSSGGGWSLLGNMHTQSESLPPPPPPITHYCCFAQCAKTKRGANQDGRTEEELQQKHRTQSDASGGFQKSTFVHFHLCRWRAERDDTIVWARGPIRWLLFL